MTFAQINCFETVAREQSFTKAASILYVSQPAISKSISRLEEELGFPLFDRRSGILRMTSAGKRIYDLFIRTERDFDETVSEIRRFHRESAEIIRLGCPDTWNPNMFHYKITEHFRTYLPSVRLEIECYRLPELFENLQAGKLDIIMSYDLHPPIPYGLSVLPLTEINCGIMYSEAHYKHVQTVDDFNGVNLLVFDIDGERQSSMLVKSIYRDMGFLPNVKLCSRFSSAVFNMSCGKGVLLITDWDNVASGTPCGRFMLPYRVPVNLVYQNFSDRPSTPLFVDELLEAFSITTDEPAAVTALEGKDE